MSTALAPMTLDDTTTLAATFVKSGFFKDSRDAAQAVVKIMAGRELGFAPIAAMTGIHIVEGKVSLSANLIAAAIKRSGKYTYRVTEHTADVCRIEFFEGGQLIGESSFSGEDAIAAGCANKDVWKKYRRNMLFARALSNGARWHCPDVFGGPLYTPEELGASVDGETGEVIEHRPLAPAPTRAALPPALADDAAPDADAVVDDDADGPIAAHWTDAIDAAVALGHGNAHGPLLKLIARIDREEPNPYRKHGAIMKAADALSEPGVTSLADFATVIEWATGQGSRFPFGGEIVAGWTKTQAVRRAVEGDERPELPWDAPAGGNDGDDDDVIDAVTNEDAAMHDHSGGQDDLAARAAA